MDSDVLSPVVIVIMNTRVRGDQESWDVVGADHLWPVWANHTCISHCWVNHLWCSGHKLRLH